MENAKLNSLQLFFLMFIFNMGTAIIISYGIQAKKDAWIATLLAMCGGILLFFIYNRLFRMYPTLSLTLYIQKIFGKYIGWIVGYLYAIYFLYIASRNVRDFSDLLNTAILRDTPSIAIIIPMVFTICYVIYLGIEVIARTAEIFIVILFAFGIIGYSLIFISGNIEFHHLLPVLENGWKPIFIAAFKISPLPFGEMVVFTMLLPYLNERKKAKKVWLFAVIATGIVLCINVTLNIAVLGLKYTEYANFPTFTTIGKVNLLDFIQRLDAIVVFTLLITVFFKACIFIYASIIGITELFYLKHFSRIIYPIGMIVIFSSLAMAPHFTEHIKEGEKIIFLYHIPLFLIFPILLLLTSFIRKKLQKEA